MGALPTAHKSTEATEFVQRIEIHSPDPQHRLPFYIRAAFTPANVLFSVCKRKKKKKKVPSLNDYHSLNNHFQQYLPIFPLSPMCQYMIPLCYEKDPMVAAIFVRYSKRADFSFASIQQKFAVNSRSI